MTVFPGIPRSRRRREPTETSLLARSNTKSCIVSICKYRGFRPLAATAVEDRKAHSSTWLRRVGAYIASIHKKKLRQNCGSAPSVVRTSHNQIHRSRPPATALLAHSQYKVDGPAFNGAFGEHCDRPADALRVTHRNDNMCGIAPSETRPRTVAQNGPMAAC